MRTTPAISCLFFFVISKGFGLLVGIKWSVYISKSQRIYASHSLRQILICAHTIWKDGEILTSCTIPNGSPLSTSCSMFCTLLSQFALSLTTWLTTLAILLLIIYFCFNKIDLYGFVFAAIRSDLVSLLMFPFLNYVHVFSCAISTVSRLKLPYSCFSSQFYFLLFDVFSICFYFA